MNLSDPARRVKAIDLSAADFVPPSPAVIYVNGGGDVYVDTVGGTAKEKVSVQGGSYIIAQVTKVYSAANGTTATGLTAFFS